MEAQLECTPRFCTFGADLYAQSVLNNKLSALELSRKLLIECVVGWAVLKKKNLLVKALGFLLTLQKAFPFPYPPCSTQTASSSEKELYTREQEAPDEIVRASYGGRENGLG